MTHFEPKRSWSDKLNETDTHIPHTLTSMTSHTLKFSLQTQRARWVLAGQKETLVELVTEGEETTRLNRIIELDVDLCRIHAS